MLDKRIRGIILLVALVGCAGCGGGIVLLSVSEIDGPGSMNENQVADYAVTVSSGLDLAYAWAVDPSSAGDFTNADNALATFHANEVTVNTTVDISVSVTGFKAEPELVTRAITIVDTNQAPVAAAHSDKSRIGNGQEVRFFDDTTDPEGGGDIIKWEWDFDFDGNAGFHSDSEEREPIHRFDTAGDYRVQLRVTDTSGISDMLDTPLSVAVVENVAPVITQVNHSRTTSEAGNEDEAVQLEVVFEDYAPPGGPHSIIWSCDYGWFDDYTSPTPKWFPGAEVLECDIAVHVIDEFGLIDSGSVHQWTTSLPTIVNSAAPGNLVISESLVDAFDGTLNPAAYAFPNDTADGNVVLASFWATWSGNSVAGIPALLSIYGTYASESDYIHLMINIGEQKETVMDFVTFHSYEGPYWLLDTDAGYYSLTRGWNGDSNGLPQTFVFDRDGRCRWAYVGQVTSTGDLESAIDQLL